MIRFRLYFLSSKNSLGGERILMLALLFNIRSIVLGFYPCMYSYYSCHEAIHICDHFYRPCFWSYVTVNKLSLCFNTLLCLQIGTGRASDAATTFDYLNKGHVKMVEDYLKQKVNMYCINLPHEDILMPSQTNCCGSVSS